MSESSFPFQGGTALAEPPSSPAFEPESSPDNRGKLLLLAGGAGVVVLAVVAYFLFFAGSGSDSPAAAPVPRAVVPSAAPSPAAAPPAKKRLNAKSFGRDPFKALIVEQASGPATGTTVPTNPTGTPVSTGATGSTGTTTGGTSSGGVATVPTVTASHTFRVVNVSADHGRITVRVDGKDYQNLKAGEVFATYFKVVVIGGKVNGFTFGDERFSVFGTKRLYIAA